jgi:UPF0716 protein FxsA
MQLGLFLIFVAVPLIEIAILIKVGQWIGFFPTLLIVISTAIAGAYVLHSQGLQVARRAMDSLAKGEPPIAPIVDGSFLMIAGALLLTPGILTDLAGIALLFAPIRRFVSRWVVKTVVGSANFNGPSFERKSHRARPTSSRDASEPNTAAQSAGPDRGHTQGPIIDGEFERLDEKTVDPKRKAT